MKAWVTQMSDEISKDEIQEVLANKKIEFAPRDSITSLQPFVKMVLEAIDFSSAWVSDRSRVDDFPLDEVDMAHAQEELGVPVVLSDYIVDVAKRVRDLHAGVGQKGGGPSHRE